MRFIQGFLIGASLSVLLFCISISAAWADGNVVLLSSFGSKGKDQRLERKLERVFRRHIGTGFLVKTIHNADQEILYRELNDPTNQAVFWVSHAAYQKIRTLKGASNTSIAPTQMILDYRGDNVAPIFQRTHPGLRFVGVIGCHSEQILQDLESPHFLASGKIRGPQTLKRAISKFKIALQNPEPNGNTSRDERPALVTLKIQRSIALDAPEKSIRSLRVMQAGQLLGVVPASLPGEVKEVLISVDPRFVMKPLEIQTGQTIGAKDNQIIFGEITVSYQEHHYRLFASNDGVPFGKNMRVFLP